MCQTLWRYMKDHACSIVSFQNQKLVGISFLLMLCCIIHCLGIRWLRILIIFGFGQIYWGRISHVELFRCWIEWIVLQVIFIWFCNFIDWCHTVSNGHVYILNYSVVGLKRSSRISLLVFSESKALLLSYILKILSVTSPLWIFWKTRLSLLNFTKCCS